MKTIASSVKTAPPTWAVLERQLIDAMDQAAPIFIEKYTRLGGALIWMEGNPGDDIWADDLYEGFFNWPFFYDVGGSDYIAAMAVQEWNAITRQITYDYDRLTREFINDDDWFHNGENYVYFSALGLVDPTNAEMMRRARRFAGMYMGNDPQSPNYDKKHRIIRSPYNGGKGPLFRARYDDVHYNLVHQHVNLSPVYEPPENWFKDEAERQKVHQLFDEIVMQGDVPVNLSAVALGADAYLYTGEDRYRNWVAEYVGAWMERIEQNGGIIPDNVGPNGVIGENRQGQWWGGLYGWSQGIGFMSLSMTIASECAQLVTGDDAYLNLIRSQLDMLMERGVERDGRLEFPSRHSDEGWSGYSSGMYLNALSPIHLWAASMEARDWQRLEQFYQADPQSWDKVTSRGPREMDDRAWIRFLAGEMPDYPEQILQANYQEVCRRVEMIQTDQTNMTAGRVLGQPGDEHHWQLRNPVLSEALVQLTTGGPPAIYWGGLSRGRLRYFDPQRQRPGLPPDTAALVTRLEDTAVEVELVNLSVHRSRPVVLQAGSFAEHSFGRVEVLDEAGQVTAQEEVEATHFEVELQPGSQIKLRLGTRRHCNKPSFAFPWHGDAIPFR